MAERVPGIEVTIVNDTSRIQPPTFQRYPLVIGMGDPYRLISDTPIVRSVGIVDSIPATTTVNDIVTVGNLPGIAGYVDGTDYTLNAGANTVSWIPGGSSPTLANTYYMTFTETRAASAYNPILYFDGNLVIEDHGNLTRTNAAINDVSVGANIAFNNGSKGVTVLQLDTRTAVDPDNPTLSELETAFLATVSKLETLTGAKYLLVPMSSGVLNTTTAAQIMFNHAVLASQPSRKQERTVLQALAAGSSYTQFVAAAAAYDHERMVTPAVPEAINVIGFSGTYDNRYANAAMAGKLCSGYIGQTFSDEILSGITFTENYNPDVQNYLVQNGVSPMKASGGVVRLIMGITTDTTNALTEDLGVQDIADYTKKVWREGLYSVYRNKPTTSSLAADITASSENLLEVLVADNVVADFSSVTARQDGTEPRKYLVTGKILPVFGLQWMDITFTFVLSSGSL